MTERFRSSAKDPLAEMQRQINSLQKQIKGLEQKVRSGAGIVAIPLTNLQHLPIRGPDDTTQYQLAWGSNAAVNSDISGWCNYTIAPPWATATDRVLAMNSFAGTSGIAFMDIQITSRTVFRCFVNSVGLNCSCVWIAIGH
jgi:hypothetical protein